jgi:CO dehydrogenase/acetyl-CoA synthase alpha subunit
VPYLKPCDGVCFCTFDDCAHFASCGLRLSDEIRQEAKRRRVRVATYGEKPRHCHSDLINKTTEDTDDADT